MTTLSVVIPTFNRAEILDQCLEHLARQSIPSSAFEVVVADDASTDATPQVADRWIRSGRISVGYQRCEKGFAGAARNRGVLAATGRRIVFLGDDVLAAPNLLEAYLRAEEHWGADASFVGLVQLARVGYSGFMEYLEETGSHHDFPTLWQNIDRAISGWYFYACNASVLRDSHLEIGGFNESILRAYEDGEYGTRLVHSGHPLYFWPHARGTHVHPTSASQYLRFLRNGRRDIAAVTRLAVANGEPAPVIRSHPWRDRLPLDPAVGLAATGLDLVDRVLPRAIRWRLYSKLLAYERRQAFLLAQGSSR